MTSTVSSSSDSAIAANAGRPSYESFLRIKQGIGSEALRAAGLPAVENLSYDAYVAALNRKAAEKRAAEPTPSKQGGGTAAKDATDRGDAKRIAWAGVVVVPVALVFLLLVADMFKDRPDLPSSSEAVAAPLTSDGLPVMLAITGLEEMPSVGSAGDEAAPPPAADFGGADVAAIASTPTPTPTSAPSPPPTSAMAKAELLPVTPIAKPTPAAAIAPQKATAREPAKANALLVPERRAAVAKAEKTPAKPVRQAAKKQDDFWQPLVDLLNGKGVRGARNVPAPEDRAGR